MEVLCNFRSHKNKSNFNNPWNIKSIENLSNTNNALEFGLAERKKLCLLINFYPFQGKYRSLFLWFCFQIPLKLFLFSYPSWSSFKLKFSLSLLNTSSACLLPSWKGKIHHSKGSVYILRDWQWDIFSSWCL